MNIEAMMEALAAAPEPAPEFVTLDRRVVESILTDIESRDSHSDAARHLLHALREPKIELWATHSVGPGEVTPCLNKAAAEQSAIELRAIGEQIKADMAAKGENVDSFPAWVINVIPSPWSPAEHFELMAAEWVEHYEVLSAEHKTLKVEFERVSNNRDMWKGQVERQAERLTKMRADREALLAALICARRVASERLSVTEQVTIDDLIAMDRSEQL